MRQKNMKTLVVIVLLMSATAMANETYNCDWYNMSASEQSYGGGSYSVVVKTGGGAEVIVTPQNPTANPYRAYDLDVYSQDGRIFTSTTIEDLTITFTRSSDKKAGVLRIKSTMPMYGGGSSPAQMYICTQ